MHWENFEKNEFFKFMYILLYIRPYTTLIETYFLNNSHKNRDRVALIEKGNITDEIHPFMHILKLLLMILHQCIIM